MKQRQQTASIRKRLCILICSIVVCLGACSGTELPDYDLYENMRSYAEETFQQNGAVVRSDFPAIFNSEYIIDLKGIFRLVFGAGQLEVHLVSYESDRLAVGSLSQFEVPPGSGNFTDFAFIIRPAANLRAPFLHGDALKAMAGMDGSFSLDFYNVNSASITLEEFFGDEIEKINDALDLVEPYQRQGEDRGKYVDHLKDFISPYRIEIDESYIPEGTDRKEYFDAALESFQLCMDAYFNSLARLAQEEDDQSLINGNKQGTDLFIDTLYENDFAAQMGMQLFGDDFDTYYLDGAWRDGYYGPGL